MKRKLLVVMQEQYGYHTDTYKYCVYLKDAFDVTYYGWEKSGLQKIHTKGVTVRYISRKGNKVKRYFRFLREMHQEIRKNKYDLVFFVYFPGSSIIRLLNSVFTFNIDIRSGTISGSKIKNYLSNLLLRAECLTFNNITVISRSLADALKIRRYHLLPLGGECFSDNQKLYDKLNLLYVGTLHGRNIIECVKGVHEVVQNKEDDRILDVSFTIIGDSTDHEKEEIQKYIEQNDLGSYIKLEGYVHNSLLHQYFERANIGVSYIPITDYFEHQPPTKTFEYLISGLPVIATKTKEHKSIVKEDCGLLIEDNADKFAIAIREMMHQCSSYNSEHIRNNYAAHLWKNIVSENLLPYINRLISNEIKQESPALIV